MHSSRRPADYRIQKMRAAEESSRQMNAYVKSINVRDLNAQWENNTDKMIAKNQFKKRFEALKARADATLDVRREKLAGMLFEEEQTLQHELVANQVTPEERHAALVERARALVAKRETERARFAEQQLYRQWRAGCDGVRQGDSFAMQEKALAGRGAQVERKVEEREAALREKIEHDAAYERERLKKEARYAGDLLARKHRDEEGVRLLNEQLVERRGRRDELADEAKQDVVQLKAKWAADEAKAAAQAQAKAYKSKQIAEELHVFNVRRKAELAAAKAEEEDFKKKLLDDAMAQIAVEEQREAELKERKKGQDLAYREHLAKLVVKGHLDETERDKLIAEEQAKYDAKRQEEKDREERARANLMAEVFADRERQLAAKAARRELAAEDKAEERRRMEVEMAEMAVAESDHAAALNAVQVRNRLDIEAQIQYRDSMAAKQKEEQRRQWESSMRAEADYKRAIENDQRQSKPATPNYARKSTAWYD